MNVVMYRGDDTAIPLSLTSGGQPVDLTNADIVFTCRTYSRTDGFGTTPTITLESPGDIDIDADPTTGDIVVNVPASATVDIDPQTLICDVQVTDGGLIRTYPEPLDSESTLIKLKVRQDITYA